MNINEIETLQVGTIITDNRMRKSYSYVGVSGTGYYFFSEIRDDEKERILTLNKSQLQEGYLKVV